MIKASAEFSQDLVDKLEKAALESPILYSAFHLETSPLCALATACIALVEHSKKLQTIAESCLETRPTRTLYFGDDSD